MMIINTYIPLCSFLISSFMILIRILTFQNTRYLTVRWTKDCLVCFKSFILNLIVKSCIEMLPNKQFIDRCSELLNLRYVSNTSLIGTLPEIRVWVLLSQEYRDFIGGLKVRCKWTDWLRPSGVFPSPYTLWQSYKERGFEKT